MNNKIKVLKKYSRMREITTIIGTKIFLEISPMNSTCKGCGKIIRHGTERYKVIDIGSYGTFTETYHKRCVPLSCKKIINKKRIKK